MRILLVVPRFVSRPGEYYEFPLGLSYIGSSLKSQGHQVDGLNLNHRTASMEEELSRSLKSGEYDILGTGGLSPHFTMIAALLHAAKKIQPNIKTIVGGGLVTSEPELVCEKLAMDAGVVGEGERTVVALVESWRAGQEPDAIPGVVYLRKGRPVLTAPRPPIMDLENIPEPDYDLFEPETYLANQKPSDNYYLYPFDRPRLLPVISSRSCPYVCTFCFHPLGRTYRSESAVSVLKKIARYQSTYDLNMVAILDELFALDPQRVDTFCEGLSRLKLKWIAQIRVDQVEPRILRKLKESGLFCISYGVESAAPDILRSMRKQTTVTRIEKALDLTQQEAIGIQGNLLFGDPAETRDTARQSLEWAQRHASYGLNLNFVVPYPGSSIYCQAVDRGIIKDKTAYLESGCPPINLTRLDSDDLVWLRSEIMSTRSLARRHGLNPTVEIIRSAGEDSLYQFSITCPFCGARNIYCNFRTTGIGHAKVACRVCHQHCDYRTTLFPHITRQLAPMIEKTRACAAEAVPLALIPSFVDVTFKEYLDFLNVAVEELDIRMVIDQRPELKGRLQLNRIPILPPTAETMRNAHDLRFLVLPCPLHEQLVRTLHFDFKIASERIIHLNAVETIL